VGDVSTALVTQLFLDGTGILTITQEPGALLATYSFDPTSDLTMPVTLTLVSDALSTCTPFPATATMEAGDCGSGSGSGSGGGGCPCPLAPETLYMTFTSVTDATSIYGDGPQNTSCLNGNTFTLTQPTPGTLYWQGCQASADLGCTVG